MFVFTVFVVKFSVVKRDFNCCAFGRQFIQVHAHFVKRLTKIFIATHRPTHLQRLFGNVMLYAWFVFIGAASTI